MIKITKKAAEWMQKEKGLKFNDHLFKTHTRHPSYYCTESPNVLIAYEEYEKKIGLNL